MSLRRWVSQTGLELRLLWRNAENLLVTLAIPIGLLVFFALVPVLPSGPEGRVTFLVPGILALAVMSTAMVSLGIATGFDRQSLVLKRLGATPLRRGELVAAKICAVLVTEAVQVALIAGVGVGLAWRPEAAGLPGAIGALLLGTAAFSGVGLLLAGRLPALLNLALVNAVYVVLLLASGLVFPLDVLPGPLAASARALPAAALGEALRAALGGTGASVPSLAVLAAWAVAAPTAAAGSFRWE